MKNYDELRLDCHNRLFCVSETLTSYLNPATLLPLVNFDSPWLVMIGYRA